MKQTDIIRLYLDGIIASVNMLSGMICSSGTADIIAGLTATMLDYEERAENNILAVEADFNEPELVRECRSSILESNKAVIVHLEKFQLQGYHFEAVIHSLKLENETLSKEIYFG